MINFDAIGRVLNDRLIVSGLETGEGMAELLEPILDSTKLEIVKPQNMSGASDHTSFYTRASRCSSRSSRTSTPTTTPGRRLLEAQQRGHRPRRAHVPRHHHEAQHHTRAL